MSGSNTMPEEEGRQVVRHREVPILGIALLTLLSCAHKAPTVIPIENKSLNAAGEPPIQASVLTKNDLRDPLFEDLVYPLTDAEPVGESGFFVGTEFDFTTAMMMPELGAGLAAKKRRDKNEAIARLLKDKTVDLAELLKEKLAQQVSFRAEEEYAVLGLIFGEPKTAVQIHVVARDRSDEGAGKFLWRITHVSQAPGLLEAEGDQVVSVDQDALGEIVNKAVGEIAKTVAQWKTKAMPSCETKGPKHVCPLGGRQKSGDVYSVDDKNGLFCDPQVDPARLWFCSETADGF